MKTLYVSDLDGTLLRPDVRTSPFTNETINRLAANGMLFSYATARSYHTARQVTQGLDARIPLIIYNGAMMIDNADGTLLASNFFGQEAGALLGDLLAHGLYPIVYAMIDGEEKFSFIPDKCSRGVRDFLSTREGDARYNPVATTEELARGQVFYFTCIDDADKLAPLYAAYRDRFHCVFSTDIYSGDPWLEIMPLAASKANAARQLKALLGCDRLVAFGDGKNDVDLFEAADEAYAMENAVPELKAVATAVIASNAEDGVAKWLSEHAEF